MRQRRLQAKARVIARQLLLSQLAPTGACRQLELYSDWVPEYFTDSDKQLLKCINSETDSLPVGKLAENWHPDFLPAKLEELAKYDTQIGPAVRAMCAGVLERAKSASSIDEAAE